MPFEMKHTSTEVLVIGSGAAGMMAAIKATLNGAQVLLLTKGPWPSGNSSKALSGYAAAFGHADPRDNSDVHFGDVVRNGIGLSNQQMVDRWTREICTLTDEMVGWGLDLVKEDDDHFSQIPWEGHTYPRMVHHHRVTGKYLMKCLGDKAKALNLQALQHCVLGGLLKTGDRVTGAWAFNYRTGEIHVIAAKAVILAFGGIGGLYPLGDNVAAVTGEGFGFAFEAGAEAIGMEFSHYLATPVWPEKMQVKFVFLGFANGLMNQSNARLYNGKGERFMWRYFPETGEKGHPGEHVCVAMSTEIMEGRGGPHGGIFLDVTDVPESFHTNPRYARIFELAARGGIDLKRQMIELVTYPHDIVGGLKIDVDGRTNVPGLYAAGEATGGSHGASRFGGSALSDCLVFGAATGVHAATNLDPEPIADIDPAALTAISARFDGWTRAADGIDPLTVTARLSDLAFRQLNVVRTPQGLQETLAELDTTRRDILPRMVVKAEGADRLAGLRAAVEAAGQVRLCEMMATAALTRTESRGGFFGGHYRTDYPEQNDEEWLNNVILFNDGGRIATRIEEPTRIEITSEVRRQVMQTGWVRSSDPESFAESE